MKIVVESHIPYIKGLLEPFGEVSYVETSLIDSSTVSDADALIVRTRTRCDAALLDGSKVKFIGTATIGTDHIDLGYCRDNGITVCNAPGCNAPAVAQYVMSVIGNYMQMRGITQTSTLTLGVVGVGHVGSIIARWAKQLGFKVLLNDPPRAEKEYFDCCADLDEVVANSDIITFHTPLTREGRFATWHLCDADFLGKLGKCRLIINAARGGICDNNALQSWNGDVAIDCWENEPGISRQLLAKAFVATPHIAGYSSEGKRRATAMIIKAINSHFGINAPVPYVSAPYLGAADVTLAGIMQSYNPLADTAVLKSQPENFENLRNHYNLRHEVE
jgi:erythronate-4-phosphate dehydrogenase